MAILGDSIDITALAAELPFPIRYYYIFTSSNDLTVTVLRGADPPKITGGRGGWERIARRRRKALTSWKGRDPVSMDVPILFDGYGVNTQPVSIDVDVETLNLMALGDDFIAPPTVYVEGQLPARGITWVIDDIEWGSEVIYLQDPRTGDDIRVRQDAIVKLLQYVQPDVVKIGAAAAASATSGSGSGASSSRTVTTKDGDTLRKVARRGYGDAASWTKVRDANPNFRDPNQKIPTGTTITLPKA